MTISYKNLNVIYSLKILVDHVLMKTKSMKAREIHLEKNFFKC